MEPVEYPLLLSLVCGSRSLVERPGGVAWARHLIECICDHASLVVTGDAPGPDTWTREHARHVGLRCVVFALDGTVREGADGRVIGRWCTVEHRQLVERSSASARVAWPLVRNTEMVKAVARRARQGRPSIVHALMDPRSSSGGTGQTVREARRAGLQAWVEQFVAAQAAEGTRA